MNLIINKKRFEQLKKEKNVDMKYTILVVDDELANIESLTRILEEEYTVIKAMNGSEALATLRSLNPPRINLIISDQRMPDMTGVEFLKQTIPIIPNTIRMVLTGYMDVNDIIDSINEGQIYKFLTKPIEPNDLLISVKRALEAYELRIQNIRLLEKLKQSNENLEKKVEHRTYQLNHLIDSLKKQKEELACLFNFKIMAEKALQESEEKYRTVFETTGSATIIIEEDRSISLANAEFCKISGYSREEIVNKKTFGEFISKDDLTRLMEYHRVRMITPNEVPRNYEFQFIDWQDNIKDMLMTIALIPGTKKSVGSMIDITERKQIEKEIARLDQLNLVGEMAAGIGHEIRNPMTTVHGFLQIIKNKKECEQFREYFDLMLEELDRANSIITEYLSLAKNKAVDLKAQNLNQIVEALFPLIQADALNFDKYVQVELAKIPDLLLDEKEIRQLILNLVRNGLEAMLPGGNLTIKTFLDNEEIFLAIQDQGPGINDAILAKIGTPFFTTKEKGTGLGLSVCYSIAARHNATIHIQTSLNGTTFLVRFKIHI
ncbi:MAG: ATP-binding protein [Desulfitobacteriaceae bacterium]